MIVELLKIVPVPTVILTGVRTIIIATTILLAMGVFEKPIATCAPIVVVAPVRPLMTCSLNVRLV
jgi:hypothetical protein